jgi:phytoene synthase
VTPDADLDETVRVADPDRWLASRFIADPAARADVVALYAFDHELTRAPRATSNPLMGEIRLTWWREVLDEVFEGRLVRRHPTAQGLAKAVRRRGLPRPPLEGLIDARYDELGGRTPSGDDAGAWADAVGGGMMRLVALTLDPSSPDTATAAAGRLFGLGRLGQRAGELAALRREARQAVRALSVKAFPAVLPAALAGRAGDAPLTKRARLTWAAATGRV